MSLQPSPSLIDPFPSAGYPIISYFTKHPLSYAGGFNLGGINASGQASIYSLYHPQRLIFPQIPTMPNNVGLIDIKTPYTAHTIASFADGTEYQLVFSDEFETENRTFWPGDDAFWEAVNLHYWQV